MLDSKLIKEIDAAWVNYSSLISSITIEETMLSEFNLDKHEATDKALAKYERLVRSLEARREHRKMMNVACKS
jgi:hypothetical protein